MTGYGKAQTSYANKNITVELRALNSKFLDINPKIPLAYRAKEIEIRKLIQIILKRGKVDLSINIEYTGAAKPQQINTEMFTAYYKDLEKLQQSLGAGQADLMSMVFRIPNIIKGDNEALTDEEWDKVQGVLQDAMKQVMQFRKLEGNKMEADCKNHVLQILESLKIIEEQDPKRIVKIRSRLEDMLSNLSNKNNLDENRFEQEIIFYLDKLDINEEKIRLKTHCDAFLKQLETSQNMLGKKLAFISQEMGREINTLGSKANDANIQQTVVQMKDHLEQIKELLLNIL